MSDKKVDDDPLVGLTPEQRALYEKKYYDDDVSEQEVRQLRREYGDRFSDEEQFQLFCRLPLNEKERAKFVSLVVKYEQEKVKK